MTKRHSRQFIRKLLDWHSSNARVFPWRDTHDPYHILIAELLLQRTRANQVVPVYERFITLFPTGLQTPDLPALQSVIKSLGLPSRAERIYRILCRLRDNFTGRVPDDPKALESMLGGSHFYVRDAVLLYAFGSPTAPVDRTIARVLSRVFLGSDPNPGKPHANPVMLSLAKQIVPIKEARSYNLALLDFAALICTPRPKCDICPMNNLCQYYGKRVEAITGSHKG